MPASKPDAGLAPSLVKRIAESARMAARDAQDPRWGSVAGQMLLTGRITAPEFAAAVRYATLRGQYDRAMGMPGRMTLSPDYGVGRGISAKSPLSARAAAAIRRDHAAMLEVAGEPWPSGTVSVDGQSPWSRSRRTIALLDRVLVDDLSCEWAEEATLRAALDRLVLWFGVEG